MYPIPTRDTPVSPRPGSPDPGRALTTSAPRCVSRQRFRWTRRDNRVTTREEALLPAILDRHPVAEVAAPVARAARCPNRCLRAAPRACIGLRERRNSMSARSAVLNELNQVRALSERPSGVGISKPGGTRSQAPTLSLGRGACWRRPYARRARQTDPTHPARARNIRQMISTVEPVATQSTVRARPLRLNVTTMTTIKTGVSKNAASPNQPRQLGGE
jgi:hypothetical protein